MLRRDAKRLVSLDRRSHRRIRLNDLMAYKQVREERSTHAMESLAVEARELRMGYEAKGP